MRVWKRCGCRDAATGRQLGAQCAALAKQDHGSWEVRVSVPGPDGTPKRKTASGFATKRAAERRGRELLALAESGVRVTETGTLARWLDTWLKRQADRDRSDATMRSYEMHVRLYLVPTIGHIRLVDLLPIHVEEMARAALRGEVAGLRGPSAVSLQSVRRTLRSALNDARRNKLVVSNAAADAELPKAVTPKVAPYDPDELVRYLKAVRDHPLGPLFAISGIVGLRRGECCGLRWSDVYLDADRPHLVVRQQLDVRAGGVVVVKPIKTAGGQDRVVLLDDYLVEQLRCHRVAQDAQRHAWGADYDARHDLVFCSESGAPLRGDYLYRQHQRMTAAAGLRHTRFHDLRHAAASLMFANHYEVAVVSKLLGHSSKQVTVDTYQHLYADLATEVTAASTRLLREHGL